MERPSATYLSDILQAIDLVQEAIAGHDVQAFAANLLMQRAVERCIEIISEASRRIPESHKVLFPDVPWSKIATIGNIFRHEYPRVSAPVVWLTATQSLPQLRPVIVALLAKEQG